MKRLNDAPEKLRVLLLNSQQAAEALAISPRTLWARTSPRGPIPSIRIGNCVRYSVDDLREMIDQMKTWRRRRLSHSFPLNRSTFSIQWRMEGLERFGKHLSYDIIIRNDSIQRE